MAKTIMSFKVTHLQGLIFALTRMSHGPLVEIYNDTVLLADAPMQASLECETLTDRSEVYNVIIRPTGPSEPMTMMNRIADRIVATYPQMQARDRENIVKIILEEVQRG